MRFLLMLCEKERKPKKDLTGQKFGRLIVLGFSHYIKAAAVWDCKCECGNTKKIRMRCLLSGDTKSCGCIGKFTTTTGFNNDRIYKCWNHMIDRCTNPKSDRYKNYGARGIKVCDEWANDYHTFREWAIKNGYSEKLSIDRIDVNGNYEPSNCKWSTEKEQMNNMTRNHFYEYNGKKQTIAQWAEEYGMTYRQLEQRLRTGWDIESALTRPIQRGQQREYCHFIEWNGETHNVSQWAKILGIKQRTLDERLKRGWSVEDAFTIPVNRIQSNS